MLAEQEVKWGLREDAPGIGTRDGWAMRLAEKEFALMGHRLMQAPGEAVGDNGEG